MSNIVWGIDPDSKAHGVACYVDGVLVELNLFTLMQIIDTLKVMNQRSVRDITVHIEDVCGMSAVFRQRQKSNQAINMKMSNSVGRCQQSQIELERVFDAFNVKVVKHKISKTWKKDKSQFEKVTRWKGRSNEDTRSAAYFGFIGIKALMIS